MKHADGREEDISEDDEYIYVVERPNDLKIWEDNLKNEIPDGVSFIDGIEAELKQELKKGVDVLLKGKPDYHPGSGTKVRDLVHPSLFVHVDANYAEEKEKKLDRWSRPYESSKFQWLPTTFSVDEEGKTKIDGAINNLEMEEHGAMYDALAKLFSEFVPLFENAYGYAQTTSFFDEALEGEHELPEGAYSFGEEITPLSLKGRSLQVITKIVEYKLEEGETQEGVWHVEGMSHEHILATGVCVLHRDENLEGGTLRFKRSYTEDEAGYLFWSVNQIRTHSINQLVDEGLIPVGSVDTPEERLLVFPNSHIHKLSEMKLRDGSGVGKRQIIVFWLIDPDERITDMKDVEKPQSKMSFEEACELRLELMNERRLHKQTHNIRTVSLCEH